MNYSMMLLMCRISINQIVQINWKNYPTSELWNFLIWLNWYRAGLSLEEIKNYWWVVETTKASQQWKEVNIAWEEYDQRFYEAWYTYWLLEKTGLTIEELKTKRDYLLNKAQNGWEE